MSDFGEFAMDDSGSDVNNKEPKNINYLKRKKRRKNQCDFLSGKFWNFEILKFQWLSFFLSYIECPNSRSERIDNLLSHSNYHHTHHHRVDSAQVESKVQLQRRSRTPKNEYKTLLRKKYAISKKRSLLFFVHSISLLLFFPALSLSLLFLPALPSSSSPSSSCYLNLLPSSLLLRIRIAHIHIEKHRDHNI